MKQEEIVEIANKVYPQIIEDILIEGAYPELVFHYNIYERLSGEKGMTGEVCAHTEYDWNKCEIYLYTSRMFSEEDIIRSLIHECIHATQSKVKFDAYYLCGETYDTHPYEIEARDAEENWKLYKIKE